MQIYISMNTITETNKTKGNKMAKYQRITKENIEFLLNEDGKIVWCSAWEKIWDLDFLTHKWVGVGMYASPNFYFK